MFLKLTNCRGKYFLRPEQCHETKLLPLPSFVNSWIFGTPGSGLPLNLLLHVDSSGISHSDKAISNVALPLRVIQWNPAITKCHGTEKNVRFNGVFITAKTPL